MSVKPGSWLWIAFEVQVILLGTHRNTRKRIKALRCLNAIEPCPTTGINTVFSHSQTNRR